MKSTDFFTAAEIAKLKALIKSGDINTADIKLLVKADLISAVGTLRNSLYAAELINIPLCIKSFIYLIINILIYPDCKQTNLFMFILHIVYIKNAYQPNICDTFHYSRLKINITCKQSRFTAVPYPIIVYRI